MAFGRRHIGWVGTMAWLAFGLALGFLTTAGMSWGLGRPNRLPPIHIVTVGGPATLDVLAVSVLNGAKQVVRLDPASGQVVSILDAGWPWPALRSQRPLPFDWPPAASPKPWSFLSFREGVAAPDSWRSTHDALPLSPIWPGIALDTAVFGLVWLITLLLGIAALRSTRRFWRRRRGRCADCGYELAGLAPGAACPECGYHAP